MVVNPIFFSEIGIIIFLEILVNGQFEVHQFSFLQELHLDL
ncbi:hypothetical protein DDB_G0290643 [Dictyostelium discoideum AX4]|nr:hypothetical protein DDB_G0290643 [Dictyostelium discoideum AX4]EAL62182.1 hypothetical protein DDB_G0290643 [Dictyostelium discoideum AX4]|eukprot:XP_635660.1 hypothetical protein DDB_G0290643 [Dictyostelium discoideum AX4]